MAKDLKVEKKQFDSILLRMVGSPSLPASKIRRDGKKLARIIPTKSTR